MEPIRTPLRRFLATALSVFLAAGLGLIGPASALAQGVDRGLNFTIISDDITKSANGSVPAAPENTEPPPQTGGGGETEGGSTTEPTGGETTGGTTTSGTGGSSKKKKR